MKKGNIHRFEDLRSINGIPEIEGYRIVENHTIDSFFKTLNSHSTDLYTVRLYTENKVTTLMYGSVVGSNSRMTASEANARHGKWLRSQLSSFASTAPELVSQTNKTVIHTYHAATFMACKCAKGTIVGGWYNINADTDISLQMLAYIFLNFAALNSIGKYPDQILRERAYDTIPTDSRFGRFEVEKAKSIFLAEIFSRHDRMVARCCTS